MVRVANLDDSLSFYCDKLGLKEASRVENEAGRFTLVFLCAPGDEDAAREKRAPTVELTYWGGATTMHNSISSCT